MWNFWDLWFQSNLVVACSNNDAFSLENQSLLVLPNGLPPVYKNKNT